METKKGISFGMTFTFLDPLSENPGSRNLYYQTTFHRYDLNNYRSIVYEGLNLVFGIFVKVTFGFILFS